MAILRKSTPQKTETKIVPDSHDGTLPYVKKADPEHEIEPIEGEEGQLAIDVFQTTEEIVVVAPVAGVKLDDLLITVTDEVLTIKGKRHFQFNADQGDYFTQECFWGNFSRSIVLPESVDAVRIKASFKDGILTLRIPKVEKIKTRMIKIKEE